MEARPELGRMIGYCGHLQRLYTDKHLREKSFDVTPVQCHTLTYLACRGDGAVNQRELERELHLKPSTVNGIVGRLEEKGYISRQSSPEDGRCRLVRLTEAGRAMVGAFRQSLEETEAQICASLSKEEQAQMRGLLSRVIQSLENEVNGTC